MSEQLTVGETRPGSDANGATRAEAPVPLMLANPPKHGPFDWDRLMDMKAKAAENEQKIWVAASAAFRGLVYAIEPDGSAIRAVGNNHDAVVAKIRADGDDPQWYTFGQFEELLPRCI